MRIGWIGTGIMGALMVKRLLDAGHSLTIFSRTQQRATNLVDAGATWATSPADVAYRSEVVIGMAGLPEEVQQIFLDESGIVSGAKPGTIVIDMATSGPSLAKKLACECKNRQLHFLDAPVSGGDVGARHGTLSIFVGGEFEVFEKAQPIFEAMGKTITHLGPAGAGQHTKMVNQILIAANMLGVCEAMLYSQRAGLDISLVLPAVGAGAAGSWSLSQLAPRMAKRDFAPGFMVDHFVKDLGLALTEARRMQLCLPGLALAEQLYIAVQSQQHGRSGTQALLLALEKLSSCQ